MDADAIVANLKACFRRTIKKIVLKRSRCKTQPVSRHFGVKRVRCRNIKDHSALHAFMEGSNDAEEPGWTSDLREDFEKAVPAD